MNLKRFHLIFGILVVIVFVLTGQYMHRVYNHLYGMPDGPRMLFRTRHIYILFAGLLNLGIGAYLCGWQERWRKVLQLLGSALVVTASVLFIAAFFYDTKLGNLQAPLSRWAIFTIAYGTVFHAISGIRKNERTE
jgi:hypothetical protein